jgi:signal transduction histidine kinase
MSIDLFIVITCVPVIALLGLLIYARNTSQKNNQQYALFSIAIIFWTLCNYLSQADNSLFYTRLTFLFGVLFIYFLLAFITNFPRYNIFQKNIFFKAQTVYTFILLPIVLTPAFVSSVGPKQSSSISTSFLYPMFLGYVGYSLVLLIYTLWKQNRIAKSIIQKRQVLIVSWGVIVYSAITILMNVILPSILNNWSSSRFGPLATLLFVGIMTYAIVKHRLFDIKFIVFRALGYILSISSIAFVSFIALIFLSDLLDRYRITVVYRSILYAAITILFALLLQPFKSFFDVLTRRIFYRDAYETQTMLNEFNATIVSTIDLNKLVEESIIVIEKYIKPLYCDFAIRVNDKGEHRIISSLGSTLTTDNILNIHKHLLGKTGRVIVTDVLSEKDQDLKNLLQASSIGLIGRINNSISKNGLGYIILGYKKSGNMYNSHDVGTASIIIDELSIAIQNSLRFEEIQEFNITLQGKINDATKQLRAANEKLKELDLAKDDFISMASHQLRTPITTVNGYVSMVLRGDAGKISKTQKQFLAQALHGSRRMANLVSDLLNVSRVQSGKFSIETSSVNLADLTDEFIQELEQMAKNKKITLNYTRPKDFPTLKLDKDKTGQVIMNLIDNAIHYTRENGNINVELEDKPDSIVFRVIDNGIGVPNSAKPNLFSKFFRANNAKTTRPDGTGIGLYLAKQVVEAQGGKLIFESKESKGSTFGFSFSKRHGLD